MTRAVLLCLALFVGSASAWGNWFSKNRQTECGKFKTNRWSWFYDNSVTDIDTRKLLENIKKMDINKDGYLAFSENYDPATFNRVHSPLNITYGFSRCEFVKFETESYSVSKEVASALFSLIDVNGDLVVDMRDINPTSFSLRDTDGDGRVSVCDAFKAFMQAVAITEEQVYLRKLKYENLVYRFRKRSWFSWW